MAKVLNDFIDSVQLEGGSKQWFDIMEVTAKATIAGHETTTLTLGYSILELARRPKIQERLREELMAFPGEPTYDDYSSRLPYLDAVLKETLRLYPGLPYMERVATKADVIPLGQNVMLSDGQCVKELVVQPGQTIVIPILSMHRLDSVWKDADTFRPERWLEDLPPREQLYSGWANTLAFSDGPRKCIGLRLAVFQYKVIMTTLITRCRFEDTGAKLLLKISSSLQPWVVGQTEKGPQIPVDVHLL
ncbi:cytochrome P450 [Wolfiporia cocos MD-104 SS10]|uniref:Cytochrome P450 n=1 Tax=Wolfiporia cocos (strain MD-104) TaxID=742152 RepID=A0A2H3IY14_WOLCO|nr:cytochrome P450 [Wolfiporia cocos MD-104 SS10]